MLMSENTSNAIDKIVQRFFWMNRIGDNLVTNMSIKWSMVEAANLMHHNIVHRYPLVADTYSEIQDQFNVRTKYLETPANTIEFSSLLEGFQYMLDELMITNDVIVDAIMIAEREQDINVKVLLEKNLADLTKYINQHIILRDKAQLYGDNYIDFDIHFKDFLLFEEV